ncbi:DNA-binding protein [Paenibacillus periandrae]|uniref:DNA-binding protein n=1 Tax=Paenibacillus periandrae TaxID=1761741 RepID=UPI001F09C77D|nr:DNA-binding protein [Paenibacillus periandrae]
MSNNNFQEESASDLPINLSNPAKRALIGVGYTRLEQLTRLTETEVLKLHGMGPKAIDQLKQALAAKGMSFANKS